MKRITVFLATIAILASPVIAKTYTEEFDWSGGEKAEKFVLDVSSSDVNVKPGGDSIVIKATKTAKKEEDLDKVEVVVEDHGDVVKVRVDHNKEKDSFLTFWKTCTTNVDFEITLPSDVAFGLDASSGDSDITGIDVVGIDASSGDVELHDCKVVIVDISSGNVTIENGVKARVDVSSGDVVISGVPSVEVEASSGDIRITGGNKKTDVETASGDITIVNKGKLSDHITAETVSGDITTDFEVAKDKGTYSFESVSGEVVLNLLGDTENLDLTAEVTSSDIDIDIPALSNARISNGFYSAKSGDGSNRIDVTSISGSIEVNAK
ncbi:MAG: DUF4097 domain-containing protein [bacterium]|nr:DUF4097 domain-containing protein [bacterium]